MADNVRDDAGAELLYWPFTVEAGQDSQVLVIRVDTPAPGQVLSASEDSRAQVFGRLADSLEEFVDLAQFPIDLTMLAGPYTRFEIYVRATDDVATFERVGLSVGARRSSPAAWTV